MPTKEQLRTRLIHKLKELFQLNQPDLDFGFYKIMHAKADQVTQFIDKDLISIIETEFSGIDDSQGAELKVEYEKAVETARKFGAPIPEATEAVQEARARWEAAADTARAETEIYDHLYRFFERYYESGDFISRRYYARETDEKAAPYAIPYNGEEVKLHWANADQYYIKTAEYFNNFTVDIRKAKEVQEQETGVFGKPETPMPMHFKIVGATEGEHGNVKASDATTRFFIIHQEQPVKLTGTGELVLQFEYRPDPEKTGQEGVWRDRRKAEAVESILANLKNLEGAEEYYSLLIILAPTQKDKKRPLLARYVNQYTSRNSYDYFIHKDLGGFLRRELDFYIKNEVMHLDDIENADAPRVETYLSKIRIIRETAHKLIDLMAQLEDFQKKLWLKKKFVVETNYCITLDRIPEEFYPEIAANDAQREEWIRLFAIDEIKAEEGVKGMGRPGYTEPVTEAFLKANPHLVVDTRFFDEAFKARLIASLDDFDEQCDGVLIHSENFQALNVLQERYWEQIKCIYIDPPYNTKATEIIYKNSYKDSSWLSLIHNRLLSSLNLVNADGVVCIAIDDVEGSNLRLLLDNLFGIENRLGSVVVVHNPGGRHDDKFIATAHEYSFFYGKNIENTKTNFLPLEQKDINSFRYEDEDGNYRTREFRRSGNNSTRTARPKMFYPILVKNYEIHLISSEEYEQIYDQENNSFDDQHIENLRVKYTSQNFEFLLPIDPKGTLRVWRWTPNTVKERIKELFVEKNGDGTAIKVKDRLENKPGLKPKSVWHKPKYAAANGTNLLKALFDTEGLFSYPKSLHTVADCIRIASIKGSNILDYFAGSGTTGHAVINLNREDNGTRKYILVEMGDYFDTVLKPRIQKVIYSDSWKDGKPASRGFGISHCFKYLRLESYEDTLNNLKMDENPSRNRVLSGNSELKEDYLLHYMLDVETRGSQSLLNIDAFSDPCVYRLKVKIPGADRYAERHVDLLETFNYLIGLRVIHIDAPQAFDASFIRQPDPELPDGKKTRLAVAGKVKQDENGPWWFRKIEGWVPADPAHPDNGQKEKILIVWRKLTGDLEKDNLMLDEWFSKIRINPRELEFDTIYVNGSNNLPNLRKEEENWKVCLIEEEFMHRMWDAREV